jgi:predicted alpha/beta hydrolase family esterase
VQKDFQQAVEDGIPGHVVRVQHDGHISFEAGEASLPEVALSQRNKLGRPTSEVGQTEKSSA